MVKVSSSDILAILRRYDLAGDENVPRHIEMVTFSNPSAANTLIAFRFNKRQFYILFDDTAEDDTDYVVNQIQTVGHSVTGTVLQNPNDHITTYALPFKGKEVYLFEANSGKQRLDLELAERFPDISRSTWQKHIKAGHVSVNGETELSSKRDVLPTENIALSIPDAEDFSDEVLPIVFIDDNVIVINKPIGVLTHSKGALNDEFSVATFFSRYCDYNKDTNRPGIVHRLDRDTSGIMIGARNEQTATLLQKQFADRRTKKTYIAITDGIPKQDEAKIDLPIGRNPSAPSTFRVDPKGKNATTTYKVLAMNEDSALIKLQPRTGRTHQLRVHMAYLGTPIKGDRVYGKQSDRLYLHAKDLEITIPSGDRQIFSAPLPDSFLASFPGINVNE
ncbi:MAG: RluA family pseudouridine synthase [Candidatus Saccharimonadales bacterium]